jgi:hypothetical protein
VANRGKTLLAIAERHVREVTSLIALPIANALERLGACNQATDHRRCIRATAAAVLQARVQEGFCSLMAKSGNKQSASLRRSSASKNFMITGWCAPMVRTYKLVYCACA